MKQSLCLILNLSYIFIKYLLTCCCSTELLRQNTVQKVFLKDIVLSLDLAYREMYNMNALVLLILTT